MYCYLNGQFVDEACATVSVFDRGFLYGDGVFETMRTYDGRIAWPEQHLERLFQSAEMINLYIQQSRCTFKKILHTLIKRNKLSNAIIRLTLTRGIGLASLEIRPDIPHTTVITARPYQPFPSTYYSEGVALAIVTIQRIPIASVPPRIKSLNFLNNILAKEEATQKGMFDGIMLNQHNQLTEATTSNLFLVSGGELFTPAVTCGILEGITRNVVLSLAQSNKIACHQQPLAVDKLYAADECFLTNTSMGLMPVTRVDGHVIGTGRPGKLTTYLQQVFQRHVNQSFAERRP